MGDGTSSIITAPVVPPWRPTGRIWVVDHELIGQHAEGFWGQFMDRERAYREHLVYHSVLISEARITKMADELMYNLHNTQVMDRLQPSEIRAIARKAMQVAEKYADDLFSQVIHVYRERYHHSRMSKEDAWDGMAKELDHHARQLLIQMAEQGYVPMERPRLTATPVPDPDFISESDPEQVRRVNELLVLANGSAPQVDPFTDEALERWPHQDWKMILRCRGKAIG